MIIYESYGLNKRLEALEENLSTKARVHYLYEYANVSENISSENKYRFELLEKLFTENETFNTKLFITTRHHSSEDEINEEDGHLLVHTQKIYAKFTFKDFFKAISKYYNNLIIEYDEENKVLLFRCYDLDFNTFSIYTIRPMVEEYSNFRRAGEFHDIYTAIRYDYITEVRGTRIITSKEYMDRFIEVATTKYKKEPLKQLKRDFKQKNKG